MSAVEKLLRKGIAADPDDFSLRQELAEKLAARGSSDEMSTLMSEAPVVPDTAAEMHRFLELAAQCKVGDDVVNAFVAKYVAAQPADAWGHHVYALGLSRIGEEEQARRHYEAARKLNPETRDPALEAVLAAADGEEVLAPHPMTAPVKVRASGAEEPSEAEVEAVLAEISEDTEAPAAEPPVKEEAVAVVEEEAVVVPEARSLMPPDQRDQDHSDDQGAEVEGAVVSVEEAEHAGAEALEDGERGLFVGSGEMVHAQDRRPDTKEKISALTVALLVNLLLIAIAWKMVLFSKRNDPPEVIATHVADLDRDEIEDVQVEKKIRQAPTQSASAQVEVMTVTGASSVSIPEIEVDSDSFEPIGVGDSFGMSMSFDSGEDGGMVSFFGARSTSKKVVFVVDYSASMKSNDKDKLMRKELKRAVESLPASVEYQLIFFSGPAWYAGQAVKKGGDKKDNFYNDWVVDGSKEFKWYGGWDEDSRIPKGGKTSILFHYAVGDDEKLPQGEYLKASKANLRKSLRHVGNTPLSVGTDWRSPLKMAMNMQPDTIYFMTDGAFGTAKGVSKEKMIDDLLDYNRKHGKAKINTICMMVLQARKELEQLAEGSRGEFTLVKQDGTEVRGKDLDKVGKK